MPSLEDRLIQLKKDVTDYFKDTTKELAGIDQLKKDITRLNNDIMGYVMGETGKLDKRLQALEKKI
jgi:hypothetical protein